MTSIKLNGNEKLDSSSDYLLTVSSATYEDNGVYTCTVTFGTGNTVTKTLNQHVRYIASDSQAFGIADIGSPRDAVLSCVFYGDDLDVSNTPVSWTKSGAGLTGGRFTSSDGTYDSTTLTRTATLTISDYVSDDNGDYVCSGTYPTGGITKTSTVSLAGVGKLSSSNTFLHFVGVFNSLILLIK